MQNHLGGWPVDGKIDLRLSELLRQLLASDCWGSPCEICGGLRCIETNFSPSTSQYFHHSVSAILETGKIGLFEAAVNKEFHILVSYHNHHCHPHHYDVSKLFKSRCWIWMDATDSAHVHWPNLILGVLILRLCYNSVHEQCRTPSFTRLPAIHTLHPFSFYASLMSRKF